MEQFKRYHFIIYFLILPLICIRCSKDNNNQANDLPNADQYITWNINGEKGSMTSPNDSIGSARYATDTHIIGQSTTNQNQFYIIFSGNRDAGTYPVHFADLYINQKTYTESPDPFLVIVTKYGNVDDYIIGSYSGKIKDNSTNLYPINGNFKLKTR